MKKKPVATHVRDMPPSGIRKFFELVLGAKDIISLGVGEPDYITPWHIREACIFSLERGYTSYTSNWGMLELRERIAEYLASEYNVTYNPENQILVTTGVSEGMDLAMRAILNPGDEVIVPQPCYVSYTPCVIFAGGTPITIDTRPENEFKPTPEQIKEKITPKTKAIIISYPSNPTGTTMSKKELEEIADIATEHDLMVVSDEIYAKLTYEGEHTCFASLNGMDEQTILLNGFSKSHAMTGWRIGYAAGNSEIAGAMTKIHQYTMLCAPITAQMAALEALKNGDSDVDEMREEYNRRRKVIVSGLNRIGLHCFNPKGAFYAFPQISHLGLSSEEFAEELLAREKVAVVPGNAFGNAGEGFIRCAYAVSQDTIREALDRMEGFLKKI